MKTTLERISAVPQLGSRGFAFIVSVVLLVALGRAAGAQGSFSCLPATLPDSTAQRVLREAISLLGPTWVHTRTEHGIPSLSATDAFIVQSDAVCNAAMTAFSSFSRKSFAESFVIVKLGRVAPFFYLMTPQVVGAMGTRYLLNDQFAVIDMIGGTEP